MSEATPVYDPFSHELDEDPHPVYRWMRDRAPVYYNAERDFYALTRFRDVLDAFVDFETYSSGHGTSLEFMDQAKPGTGLMIYMDPPRHNRYRALVSKAFTPRSIQLLEPQIREIAVGYLARLEGRPRFDLVRDFSARLPMDVISAMLGIAPAERRWVQESANSFMHRDPDDPMPRAESAAHQQKLMAFFQEQIEARRRQPQDDLMTRLTQAEIEDEAGTRCSLSDDDIRAFVLLLATAGNETVTKLLATTCYELWRSPGERRRLVAEPHWIPNAVEETLRYEPPSQYQGRVTTREVELHGVRMPRGAKVLLLNGASGRDEREFPDPERFDVQREIELHLGFGYGRHFCLGASLARLESRIALEELLKRFPSYEIPAAGVERMHSSNVRGLSGLLLEPSAA